MYRKETHGLIKHIDFVILDLLCLQVGFLGAYFLFGRDLAWNPYSEDIYRNMALLIELISFVVLFANNTLKSVLKRGSGSEFIQTVKQAFYTFVLCVFFLYLMRGAEQYSRLIFGFTFVFYGILTYLVRMLWKARLRRKMEGEGEKSLLIVTNQNSAKTVINNIKENNYARYRLAGLVLLDNDDMVGQEIGGVPIVSKAEDAAMYVCHEWIDEVFVIPQETRSYPKELVNQLMLTGVTVHINLARIENMPGKKQIVEKVANYTVLTNTMNYASPIQLFAKRMMDVAGGIVGCIITGILIIFIGPIIYISSPGPIFFAQERVGRNGKKFKMYKFRSMYMDAEERKAELMAQNKISDGKMFKMDFDPRVIGNKLLPDGRKKTGIGQFIRDTSLDEFPQFVSCLMGTMSIVGTRPPIPGEVSLYDLHHKSRLAIKPGITGMWQVSGRSGITDFEEVVRLDQEYINNWNIGLDLKILLKTILVVFKREGSS